MRDVGAVPTDGTIKPIGHKCNCVYKEPNIKAQTKPTRYIVDGINVVVFKQ